jgi:hypothetical protein
MRRRSPLQCDEIVRQDEDLGPEPRKRALSSMTVSSEGQENDADDPIPIVHVSRDQGGDKVMGYSGVSLGRKAIPMKYGSPTSPLSDVSYLRDPSMRSTAGPGEVGKGTGYENTSDFMSHIQILDGDSSPIETFIQKAKAFECPKSKIPEKYHLFENSPLRASWRDQKGVSRAIKAWANELHPLNGTCYVCPSLQILVVV